MDKEYSKKKKDGATFTPSPLAHFLAERMLSHYVGTDESISIYDPACGDGALLISLSSALKKRNIAFRIYGCDKNPDYVCQTITHLTNACLQNPLEIECKDFIEEKIGGLFSTGNIYDMIIANPPYVRTQLLGSEYAQSISRLYNLSGRIDLYYPFLINMTAALKVGGILGVITSNRYLSTKSGADIRSFLLKNYEIIEVIDLGDTKLFDAAVLPAIFIGRKKQNGILVSEDNKFTSIYESCNSIYDFKAQSVYHALNTCCHGLCEIGKKIYEIKVGTLDCNMDGRELWTLTSTKSNSLISTIEKNSSSKVLDFFKVRVGIKSCADDVFFTTSFTKERPEDIWFREMISQENIQQGTIKHPLQRVLYPHYDNNGKRAVYDIFQYPKAMSFFMTHEEKLRSRKYLIKAKRNWYEYWVPQNPTLWKYPKLVWADISSEPRFAIDDSGAIVNGNCYWICASNPADIEILYLILGVANSKLIEEYHEIKFNNKLYSGKRRYLAQYVEQYPLPDISSEDSKNIIELAKQNSLCTDKNERIILKNKIEFYVRRAFGFKD